MTEPTSRPGAAARRAATPPASKAPASKPPTSKPPASRPTAPKPTGSNWRRAFLAALAETSNVARAARKAGVPPSTVYQTRRNSPDFARQWRDALCEGYDNLEMELLGRLREGEVKRAAGARMGVRNFDNATAFRLLSVHRDGAAQARAERAHLSAADIHAALERKIAAMRTQVLARKEAELPLIEGPSRNAAPMEAGNAE